MLTYVINTSENKTFDSNRLFELVGYSQIRWKHCSLSEIDLCADEICEEERSKILSTGEYRIVVLIDFFGFPRTNPADEESASEYVEIYKAFIEHYLLNHLFYTLKKNNIPAKACEIYYIQYTPYEPLSVNNMALEQTAKLLGLEDVAERLNQIRNRPDVDEASPDEDDEVDVPKKKKKAAVEKRPDGPLERKHKKFSLTCAGDSVLEFDFGREMTFEEFYSTLFDHRDDARKFGVTVHRPYVTFGDASRAAYDALSLSLYLVYLYERRNAISPDTEIRRMDDKVFVSLLRSSLRKIHSARSVALKNECLYYKLDFERKVDSTVGRTDKKEDKKKKEKKLTEEEKFLEICRLADRSAAMKASDEAEEAAESASREASEAKDKGKPNDKKSDGKKPIDRHDDEVRRELDELMKNYLKTLDEVRSRSSENLEKDRIEVEETRDEMLDQCPSDIDLKTAIDKKRDDISKLLKTSLDADYRMQDFSEEKEQAISIYKKYKQAKACESKNIIGDLIAMLVTLAAIILPYGLLQLNRSPFQVLTTMLYGVAAAIFGGLFLFIFMTKLTSSIANIRRYRLRLNELYEKCMDKQRKSLAALRQRYEYDLIRIEELRDEIREIHRRDRLNREKNRHVEIHRETLEDVENLLSGMLNSFGERTDITQIEDVRDDFKIDKPITAAENKIYKIFSMDAIDSLFKQTGGIMQDD